MGLLPPLPNNLPPEHLSEKWPLCLWLVGLSPILGDSALPSRVRERKHHEEPRCPTFWNLAPSAGTAPGPAGTSSLASHKARAQCPGRDGGSELSRGCLRSWSCPTNTWKVLPRRPDWGWHWLPIDVTLLCDPACICMEKPEASWQQSLLVLTGVPAGSLLGKLRFNTLQAGKLPIPEGRGLCRKVSFSVSHTQCIISVAGRQMGRWGDEECEVCRKQERALQKVGGVVKSQCIFLGGGEAGMEKSCCSKMEWERAGLGSP